MAELIIAQLLYLNYESADKPAPPAPVVFAVRVVVVLMTSRGTFAAFQHRATGKRGDEEGCMGTSSRTEPCAGVQTAPSPAQVSRQISSRARRVTPPTAPSQRGEKRSPGAPTMPACSFEIGPAALTDPAF